MDPKQQAAAADVAQMAARTMGVAPPAAQAPGAAPNAAPPAAQPPAPAAPAKDSAQDKAAASGSPETEGDKQNADPVIYDIKVGDKTRKMTPQQISDTLGRYAEINYLHSQTKPHLEAMGGLMKEAGIKDPKEFASHMKALMQANQKNPQMGNTEGDVSGDNKTSDKPRSADDISAQLSKWEEDNAASLPPGYKEMMQGSGQVGQIAQQMQQMQQMLRAVLAQSAGTADASRAAMQDAQSQKGQAIQRQIANNIDRVQQHLGLPDDKANDFMVFAAERGYTLEDFLDIQLAAKVMGDFKNNMDSPEMERMRQIAQRRQAFTGSMGATPSAGGAPAAPGTASPLDKMIDAAMQKRT